MDLVQDFKNAMTQMATGVTIVTSHDGTQPFGMTVSSFTSVSMKPPLVSICIGKPVSVAPIIETSKKFAVNILSAKQKDLGITFSTPGLTMERRFQNENWQHTDTKSPVLGSCLGWMDCELHQTFDAGDHFIFLGLVKQSWSKNTGNPLIYCRRSWQSLKS